MNTSWGEFTEAESYYLKKGLENRIDVFHPQKNKFEKPCGMKRLVLVLG